MVVDPARWNVKRERLSSSQVKVVFVGRRREDAGRSQRDAAYKSRRLPVNNSREYSMRMEERESKENSEPNETKERDDGIIYLTVSPVNPTCFALALLLAFQ